MSKWYLQLFRVRLEWLFVIVGTIVLGSILFTKLFVGVADNGDFLRIMGTIGLNYSDLQQSYEAQFFQYAHRYFAYDHFFRGFYFSSHIIIVAVARLIGYVVSSSLFDIRVLAVLYSLLLLAAGWLILFALQSVHRLVRISVAILLLFVFFDSAYTAYFNSLFGEPVSLLFFLLTIGFGLLVTQVTQLNRKKTVLILLFVSILFFVGSKTQNAPIGIAFSILALRYATLHRDGNWRRLAYMLSAITLLGSMAIYSFAPKEFKQINLYQTVFFGILNGSTDVKTDLQTLGLPEHLHVLAGTNYFEANTVIKQTDPSLQADFYDHISHGSVIKYYITHPMRLLEKAQVAAEHSMTIRPYYLGSYEQQVGKAPGAVAYRYSGWSEFKHQYMPRQLLFVLSIFAVYFLIVAYQWWKNRQYDTKMVWELFAIIGLTGCFSFLIPVIGDGHADLSKHMFMFNVVFDVMLVVIVGWLFDRLSLSKQARRP
ncbi:hypothetical protein ACFSTH_09975 [Paenibacillus yanchengensis]|uniref:Glycosyltransferase RgtA/B/C/D-like domain-containing protein n=1 Tax=Paenibacillus yanchengensis TaxID=2035833 RepID=A0ABW4YI91_9BACL